MRPRRLLATALLSLSLGACAPTVWTRPEATAADWRRDKYECERDARMAVLSFGGGLYAAIEAAHFQAQCLESKGYTRVAQ